MSKPSCKPPWVGWREALRLSAQGPTFNPRLRGTITENKMENPQTQLFWEKALSLHQIPRQCQLRVPPTPPASPATPLPGVGGLLFTCLITSSSA